MRVGNGELLHMGWVSMLSGVELFLEFGRLLPSLDPRAGFSRSVFVKGIDVKGGKRKEK